LNAVIIVYEYMHRREPTTTVYELTKSIYKSPPL